MSAKYLTVLLDMYEREALDKLHEAGITDDEITKTLDGWGEPNPDMIPVDIESPMDHKATWYAFTLIEAVREARHYLANTSEHSRMAAMFLAGQSSAFSEVGMEFPKTLAKVKSYSSSQNAKNLRPSEQKKTAGKLFQDLNKKHGRNPTAKSLLKELEEVYKPASSLKTVSRWLTEFRAGKFPK